jgi:hypothetical protein
MLSKAMDFMNIVKVQQRIRKKTKIRMKEFNVVEQDCRSTFAGSNNNVSPLLVSRKIYNEPLSLSL